MGVDVLLILPGRFFKVSNIFCGNFLIFLALSFRIENIKEITCRELEKWIFHGSQAYKNLILKGFGAVPHSSLCFQSPGGVHKCVYETTLPGHSLKINDCY